MTFPAFIENSLHVPKCRKHSRRQRHRCHFSTFRHTTALDGSVEDFATSTEYSIASGGVNQVIPTANFDTTSTFEPVVFEPVLNVPALITFLLITTIFSALILRTNQVEDAVQIRKRRQEEVRALKALEVAGNASAEQIRQTLKLYEDACRQEEKLRNILPGVRIVPPSSSSRKEEEAREIARQYLGQDFNIGVPKQYNEKRDDEGRLPTAAIGVLAVVALSQVGLLAFFSFGADPMSGNGSLM